MGQSAMAGSIRVKSLQGVISHSLSQLPGGKTIDHYSSSNLSYQLLRAHHDDHFPIRESASPVRELTLLLAAPCHLHYHPHKLPGDCGWLLRQVSFNPFRSRVLFKMYQSDRDCHLQHFHYTIQYRYFFNNISP